MKLEHPEDKYIILVNMINIHLTIINKIKIA